MNKINRKNFYGSLGLGLMLLATILFPHFQNSLAQEDLLPENIIQIDPIYSADFIDDELIIKVKSGVTEQSLPLQIPECNRPIRI